MELITNSTSTTKQPTVRIQFTASELQAVDAALCSEQNLAPRTQELTFAVAKIKKALAAFMPSSNYASYVTAGASGVVGLSQQAITRRENERQAQLDLIMTKLMHGKELTEAEQAAYDASFAGAAGLSDSFEDFEPSHAAGALAFSIAEKYTPDSDFE